MNIAAAGVTGPGGKPVVIKVADWPEAGDDCTVWEPGNPAKKQGVKPWRPCTCVRDSVRLKQDEAWAS